MTEWMQRSRAVTNGPNSQGCSKRLNECRRAGQLPTAPTARAGTNMPVEAPTPLVHIIKVKEKRNRQVRAPKSKRKSVPSGKGSPRWIISRRLCERGVKNTCTA